MPVRFKKLSSLHLESSPPRISPENLLADKSRCCKTKQSPKTSSGIGPDKLFAERSRYSKLLQFDKGMEGIAPDTLLPFKDKCCRSPPPPESESSHETASGPESRLKERSIVVRLLMLMLLWPIEEEEEEEASNSNKLLERLRDFNILQAEKKLETRSEMGPERLFSARSMELRAELHDLLLAAAADEPVRFVAFMDRASSFSIIIRNDDTDANSIFSFRLLR